MATFTGTGGIDTADATTGALAGFTGGTSAELQDGEGDKFYGMAGNDVIIAGSGNDWLRGGLGADTLNGGAGIDTVDYLDNFGAVFINLTIGQGFGNAAQGDTYTGIENVTGSIYNDFIIGDAGANVLNGSQGNDILIGALGADTLIGGTGVDIASYEENAGAIFINMRTGMGYGNAAQGDTYDSIEGIVGTAYDDYIIANSGYLNGNFYFEVRSYVDAGAGNDFVYSGDGSDTLIGGAGEDTISYELLQQGVSVGLSGGGARDILSGFENVIGTPYNDQIEGDDNANVLFGKLGRDVLFGGEGRDSFVFDTQISVNTALNTDLILDFTEYDYIYLDRSTVYTALPFGQLSPDAFVVGDHAITADQRIVYDQASGNLFYDPDGSGAMAQLQFATLAGSPNLAPEQIFVSG